MKRPFKTKLRSSFDVEILGDTVVIYDRDESGKMSVTNDAEAVIENVIAYGLLHHLKRMSYVAHFIYRDSTGQYDELLVTPEGKFSGFRALGRVMDLEDALIAVSKKVPDGSEVVERFSSEDCAC